ncbi:MAG: hypothetical protein NTY35_06370 [Planctomycetota bacterium]|nr:hypothetical protein [Planctomycetota bacterium]
MPRRISIFALTLVVASPTLRAAGGSCPGTPLVCVGSGTQTLVVAVGLPPRALGVLVGGSQGELGPAFGSGRWCVADPRMRLASTCADSEGTAVVRLEGRPGIHAGTVVQLVWRDRLSGMTGSTGSARMPGG